MIRTWDDICLGRSLSSVSSESSAEGTAGNDFSSFIFDDIRDDAASASKERCPHWLRVDHLSLNTTDVELNALFYPYGADEALTRWENGAIVGFVGFETADMAALASSKMNAFIPRRQSQALVVRQVSLEEAVAARNQAPKSFLSVLYSDCSPRVVSAALKCNKSIAAVAGEVATEVARASPFILQRIIAVLSDLTSLWPDMPTFSEELLKELLRSVLAAGEANVAHATNCGAIIGHLFLLDMITGDPFYLASRLLQRGGSSLPQVEGVCTLAHTCFAMASFDMSKAAFWAQVADVTTKVSSPEVAHTLRSHLRCYSRSIMTAVPTHRGEVSGGLAATGPILPSATAAVEHRASLHARQEEVKRRTVYVSHLPGALPQCKLMQLLSAAGPVSKIRICAGSGYSTLFAFVEMQTVTGAQNTTRMNGMDLMGFFVRVQTARNAIQDALREDARVDANGVVKQPCLFGMSDAPLSTCISQSIPL